METTLQKKHISEISDWDLIVMFNHRSYQIKNIPVFFLKTVMSITWCHQDGYGTLGYTPPQGWDWSGIRDSSDGAKAYMAAAIRNYLHQTCFLVIEYTQE